MPISPVGGSGHHSFDSGGISGHGSNFKLGSIRQQFEALNQKFNAIKSGKHSPALLKKELNEWEQSKKNEIPPDIKIQLDRIKQELIDMEKGTKKS